MSDNIAYTLVFEPNSANRPSQSDFMRILEKGDDEDKIDAMKQILISMLNSDPMAGLLMHIIRYVMPSKNKDLKKLLYFYWEICAKYDSEGKLRHEMILVCNAIQHDLQHPNEFIRGNTLRFLSKLKEPELLEPLIPSLRTCLEHRHAYVRKNAVFAVSSIFKVSEQLIPDAPELLADFLVVESDSTCRRNAFVCLGQLDREAALRYIQEQNIAGLDPLIQLAFIEFIRKDALIATDLKQAYLLIVSELLDSTNSAVVYEAATTLSVLSSSQGAVSSAAGKFIELAIKETDTNVKLIALERVNELHLKNEGMLEDACLDILRVLSSPSLDVRKAAIDITLKLVSSKNVDDVVKLLKKELQKTATSDEEKNAEYRQLLISAIHSCAIRFHEVAANVVDLLLESIPELNSVAATEVITFVKQVVEKFPDLRSTIIERLLQSMKSFKSGKVFRGALWIVGEYALEEKSIQSAWKTIRSNIGKVPILAEKKKVEEEKPTEEVKSNGQKHHTSTGPKILADGTYATESALESTTIASASSATSLLKTPLRALILEGDYHLAVVLSSTLVKLILRLSTISEKTGLVNALKAEAMLIMVSILRATSNLGRKSISDDPLERIAADIKILSEGGSEADLAKEAFLEDTKEAFRDQLAVEASKKRAQELEALQDTAEQVDDAIVFRQLHNKDQVTTEVDQEEAALAAAGSTVQKEDLSSRLKKITQLTGFTDPVYAEAYVKSNQFDVTLDVMLVNQTTETLRNLTVEFATLGDLKVVDKPSTQNIGPYGFHRVQSTIKVTSADTGVIFGNIVYDGQHADQSTIVILSDVHVDINDYIKPASCSEAQFRKMWNEFEWENKINVKSTLTSLKDYFDELIAGTNMNNLTPGAVIGEECRFLSANLYSRSAFGEDALANVCIEKTGDGKIVGQVRIRAKTQGLALSFGDKVAAIARKTNKAPVIKV